MTIDDRNDGQKSSTRRKSTDELSLETTYTTEKTTEVRKGRKANKYTKEEESLPDYFLNCLCCACTCQNCNYPGCFGCHYDSTTCCFETTSTCCKPVEDSTACCICCANSYEFVVPRIYHREYSQCCCFEYYSVFPPEPKGIKRPQNLSKLSRVADNFLPSSDVTMNTACLCCINSCNCQCPSCFGWYQKDVCLCCETESMGYKPLCCTPNKPNPDTLCVCTKGYFAIVEPVTLCKAINQFWCCDYRWACPCDEEVPCICGLLPYCTFLVDWTLNIKCCATINQIVGRDKSSRKAAYVEVVPPSTKHTFDKSARDSKDRNHKRKKSGKGEKKHRREKRRGAAEAEQGVRSPQREGESEHSHRRKHKRQHHETALAAVESVECNEV